MCQLLKYTDQWYRILRLDNPWDDHDSTMIFLVTGYIYFIENQDVLNKHKSHYYRI